MTIHFISDRDSDQRKYTITQNIINQYEVAADNFRHESSLQNWEKMILSMTAVQAINSGLLDQEPRLIRVIYESTPINLWTKEIAEIFTKRNPC